MTDRRVPAHLAILVGVSAGAYAVALAGVSALQSSADSRLISQRLPFQLAAEQAAREHDRAERAVAAAADRYIVLAARYERAGGAFAEVESALDGLAARAATLTESAAMLRVEPFSLPTVGRLVPRSVSPPTTHATTKASG
jgi:hypothetical protein